MLKAIKRIFKILLIIALALTVLVAGVDLIVKLSTKNSIVSVNSLEKNADFIVILGAGVRSDGTPSLMLKERLDSGIALYKSGVSKKLLLSGDHRSEYYDEVNTMKNYCLQNGVNEEDIFLDHAGLSTYDSIYRAKEFFDAENIVIVTQKYHLFRALFIAKSFGIKAKGVNCDTKVYAGQTYRSIREIFARNKDAIKCIYKPKASTIDENISLSGNENITND